MDNKVAYRKFCEENEHVPIFAYDWYLDAVCQDGSWDVVIYSENEEVLGVFPYFLKKKGPFKYITMPMLCKYMGPYISNKVQHIAKQNQLTQKLLEQLPKVDHFNQNLHYAIANVDAFTSQKYNSANRYSYRIEDLSDLEAVFKKFSTDYRNNKIKKAKAQVTIHRGLDIETFYRINKMSFERQEIPVPYSLPFLKELDQTLAAKKQREIFYAIDKDNNIHSVVYMIWDKTSAYYHIAGDDPELRKSGSAILLVWEVIQFTKNELGLNIFDFEGSMIPSIERVRKQFGATKIDYFNITQYRSKAFEMIERIRS